MLDYFKSIFENIQTRVSSPLLGAFTISFFVYNWKPIYLLLFADGSVRSMLRFVEYTYSNHWVLLAPFIMSLGYILLMPWINLLVIKIQEPVQRRYVEHSHLKEMTQLTKKVEIAEEEFKIVEARSGKKEIETLMEQLESKDKLIEASSEQTKILKSQYDDLYIKNLDRIELLTKELEEHKNEIVDLRSENLEYKQEENLLHLAEDYLRKLATKRINFLISLLNGPVSIGKLDFHAESNKYNLNEMIDKKIIKTVDLGNVMRVSLTDLGAVIIHRFLSD